jgi:hypothetical protein
MLLQCNGNFAPALILTEFLYKPGISTDSIYNTFWYHLTALHVDIHWLQNCLTGGRGWHYSTVREGGKLLDLKWKFPPFAE